MGPKARKHKVSSVVGLPLRPRNNDAENKVDLSDDDKSSTDDDDKDSIIPNNPHNSIVTKTAKGRFRRKTNRQISATALSLVERPHRQLAEPINIKREPSSSMSTVCETWSPSPKFSSSRTAHLSPKQLQDLCNRAAEENGIVRPRGYNVSFHYNPSVESHHFGRSHPMKPWRLQLTKMLIVSYGLNHAMDNYVPQMASKQELTEFHDEGYVDFLSTVTPDNMLSHHEDLNMYKFGDDCPVFDGLFEYCSLYSGSTLSAARNLTSQQSDIAINWGGGLHHAKKSEASGFCYVNDAVLAIQELSRFYPRVFYIDIDVHHGDGVEQAFFSSERVLTLSFHKYDPLTFFPGTGGFEDHGPENNINPGAHHSLNVPLNDGIDDEQYTSLFRDLVRDCVAHFRPSAFVLQCGADSIGGDRIGKFNLNITAHGECVQHIKSYGLPLLVLGGGGYTARNVARTWCHETALCVDSTLQNNLPDHIPYRQAFEGVENGDGLLYPELHNIEGKRHKNECDAKFLEKCRRAVKEQLRYMKGAPSVEMRRMPRDIWKLREELEQERKEEDEFDRRERENGVGVNGQLAT